MCAQVFAGIPTKLVCTMELYIAQDSIAVQEGLGVKSPCVLRNRREQEQLMVTPSANDGLFALGLLKQLIR